MANPSSIMGANALSWGDVILGGMFQDTAGTTSASVGDPVRFMPDGAGGDPYLYEGGTVDIPVLRDGYLEFDAGFLRKLVSRASGPMSIGIRVRRVDEISGNAHSPLNVGGTAAEWYSGAYFSFEQNGFASPNIWFGSGNTGGAGGRPAGAVDIFQTITCSTNGGSNIFRLDGEQDTPQSAADPGATERVWFGGRGTNFGTLSADPGRFDIVRFYVLDATPDSTELAALEDWLENGDAGGGETFDRSASVVSASAFAAAAGIARNRAASVAGVSSFGAVNKITRVRTASVVGASDFAASATVSANINRSASVSATSSFGAIPSVTRPRAASVLAASSFSANAGTASQINRYAGVAASSTVSATRTITRSRAASVVSASSFTAARRIILSRQAHVAAASTFQALTADDRIGQYVVAGVWRVNSVSGIFRDSTAAGVWSDPVTRGTWRRQV